MAERLQEFGYIFD